MYSQEQLEIIRQALTLERAFCADALASLEQKAGTVNAVLAGRLTVKLSKIDSTVMTTKEGQAWAEH